MKKKKKKRVGILWIRYILIPSIQRMRTHERMCVNDDEDAALHTMMMMKR